MAAKTISVARYAAQVMELRGMLANLSEFVDTLPAPVDEDEEGEYECIPGFDYGMLGTLGEIHSKVLAASEAADEMFD